MSGIRYQKIFKTEGGEQVDDGCQIETRDASPSRGSWRQISREAMTQVDSSMRDNWSNNCTPLLNSESDDEHVECGDLPDDEDASRGTGAADQQLHFPDEPLKTLLAGLFLGIGFIVTTIGLVLTHERLPEYPPLPDLLLDNVKYVSWGLIASEYIMMVATISAFVVVLFHTHRMIVFRRIFFIMGLMYYLRAITFSVTVLPKSDSTYMCDPKFNGSLPFRELISRVVKISSGGGLTINNNQVYCGDFIFSGHTMVLTASYLTITEYTPKKFFLLHWASLFLSVSGVVFLLLGRGHYTVDVVLAYLITTILWYIYHTLANTELKKGGRHNSFKKVLWWRVFRYWECNVPGPVPHRFSLPLPLVIRTFIRNKYSRFTGRKQKVEETETV